MSVSDSQCVQWLNDSNKLVRSSSLELLASSYSTNQHWLPAIFEAWDRYGVEEAFPEFPLLTHLEIPAEMVEECITRAQKMVEGRPLTDKVCRCGGKLIEALSVSSPNHFAPYLSQVKELKSSSKIFFRIDLKRMEYRAELADQEPAVEPLDRWFEQETPPDLPMGIYPHLEAAYLRGQADSALKLVFEQLPSDQRRPFALEACFELATRYRLLGYENYFAEGLDDEDTSVADASAIALSRCRNDQVLSLIADKFANYSKNGQLRSSDVLRRSRLAKTPELLRFLHAASQGTAVQQALRIAEVLQFDFEGIEDWLEALMVMDDASLSRIQPYLSLVGPLSGDLPNEVRDRVVHLIKTRVQGS